MPDDVIIDVNDQQQPSLRFIQNNNGNDRSLTSTGVGAQEKFTRITDLLEKKVAKMLGVVVCGWVLVVVVQGGMVGTLETKDCGFVTLLSILVFFRCGRQYWPDEYRSFTEATQSLSADYLSILNDIQQLALPICYIHILFKWSRLIFAMFSVVLSVIRLASQDFGKKEVENKESQDFVLKVFYGLTLAEALVLLFAFTLSFPKKRNSVALPDGPGDGPGNGPGDGPEHRPEDGPENGPGGEPEYGPEDGPENGPGGESGDGPVKQSNEWNAVAQMNGMQMNGGQMSNGQMNITQNSRGQMNGVQMNWGQMSNGKVRITQNSGGQMRNDFNSEGPADSLLRARQHRRMKAIIHQTF